MRVDGRTDETGIEGSIRGPRGPKNHVRTRKLVKNGKAPMESLRILDSEYVYERGVEIFLTLNAGWGQIPPLLGEIGLISNI